MDSQVILSLVVTFVRGVKLIDFKIIQVAVESDIVYNFVENTFNSCSFNSKQLAKLLCCVFWSS